MTNIKEKVEEFYKGILDNLHIRYYGKTEKMSDVILNSLNIAITKSGGNGENCPDIRLLLDNGHGRRIPVIIVAKGTKNKLEKLDKNGEIVLISVCNSDKINKKTGEIIYKKGDLDYRVILDYAVNGAIYYGNAILDSGDYSEVIVVGVNGMTVDKNGVVINPECKTYYISEKNNRIPKEIQKITKDNWILFKNENIDALYNIVDTLNLTEKEIEIFTCKTEVMLEEKIKEIHQSLYEDERLKISLSTNEKLYLFCGLIMASLKTNGVAILDINMLHSNNHKENNDGITILNSIISFLCSKNYANDTVEIIMGLLNPVFKKKILWQPNNGESLLKFLFKQIKIGITPCLESNLHLDFTGKILNSLNDWVSIDNDKENDVVLTPRYVTTLMAKMARTNKDSFVWDNTMGSGGFLVSAMDIMIKDAQKKIVDKNELETKIKNIKENQLLGIEILGNIYILAVLNMMLMGDGSSNILNGDSHEYNLTKNFPANVFLLNPPYSAAGKGFNFVEKALSQMVTGYACVLIQDSAGNGQGLPYTKRILEHNTLEASIKMPLGLFGNKASVSVYIFVFKVNRPHEIDDFVTFIDFSEDGYSRQNRKKSTQKVNLKNTDHAKERYEEILSIVLGEKPKTNYYTETNGLLIKDTISLNGDDWLFTQHQKINTMLTEEDFKNTISKFWSWKISNLMKEV
jgi:hypothetical protein